MPCSILHFAFMLTLGFLGFAMKSNAAAGWAVAVLINLAVSTQSFGECGLVGRRYRLASCSPSISSRSDRRNGLCAHRRDILSPSESQDAIALFVYEQAIEFWPHLCGSLHLSRTWLSRSQDGVDVSFYRIRWSDS